MPSPARALALRVLRDVERGPGTLADRLAHGDVATLEPRERAFLHELLLGTLRRRGAIDHALAPLLDRPLAQVGAEVRAVLRLGAHQILHLRVPARAAVHEAVAMARAVAPRATGFVNAVLRRLAREGAPDEPDPAREPLAWLTSAGSLPDWLARRWLSRLGAEAAVARARAALEEPPAVFRLNPRRPDALARVLAAGLEPRPAPRAPGAWIATAGHPASLHAEGLLYLQDEAAQQVAALACGPGLTLDACAAPGGKTLLIADKLAELRQAGLVVAAEASARRLATMVRLVHRWGAHEVRIVHADGERPPFGASRFERMLLDAPCSGLGTLARHPDLRWRVTEADLAAHAARQRRLLDALAPLTRPGGQLVYATCSSEAEENRDVVRGFLADRGGFVEEPLPRDASNLATGDEGFFAAILRRVH
ncbi:MAG TPA: transcription antitermination factor NusB [Vicinamibacteria bacterium]|nr:transcription antitermination factor NusB [Vicinamibacteria bacterium]